MPAEMVIHVEVYDGQALCGQPTGRDFVTQQDWRESRVALAKCTCERCLDRFVELGQRADDELYRLRRMSDPKHVHKDDAA